MTRTKCVMWQLSTRDISKAALPMVFQRKQTVTCSGRTRKRVGLRVPDTLHLIKWTRVSLTSSAIVKGRLSTLWDGKCTSIKNWILIYQFSESPNDYLILFCIFHKCKQFFGWTGEFHNYWFAMQSTSLLNINDIVIIYKPRNCKITLMTTSYPSGVTKGNLIFRKLSRIERKIFEFH